MAKLLHHSIPEDFTDYLLSAGYRFSKCTRWIGDFQLGNCLVTINYTKVQIIHTKEPFRNVDHALSQPVDRAFSFEGIDQLDFIGWAELMDLSGAIPLKQVIKDLTQEQLLPIVEALAKRVGLSFPSEVPTLSRQEELAQ